MTSVRTTGMISVSFSCGDSSLGLNISPPHDRYFVTVDGAGWPVVVGEAAVSRTFASETASVLLAIVGIQATCKKASEIQVVCQIFVCLKMLLRLEMVECCSGQLKAIQTSNRYCESYFTKHAQFQTGPLSNK